MKNMDQRKCHATFGYSEDLVGPGAENWNLSLINIKICKTDHIKPISYTQHQNM